MNVENIVKEIVKKNVKDNAEMLVEKIRALCMNYLKKYAVKILKMKITEVYGINSARHQVIDLPELFKTIKVEDVGPWNFDLYIDDDLLNYKTKSGDPIYQYYGNGEWGDTYGEIVSCWEEYWHAPINGISEPIWIMNETHKEVLRFVNNEFKKYVKSLINKR